MSAPVKWWNCAVSMIRASQGGSAPDGRGAKGTIHWVSADHAQPAEVRLYDRLFTRENPDDDKDGGDFKDYINRDSLEVLTSCPVEPASPTPGPGSLSSLNG